MLKGVCMSMVVIALAFGFSGCSSEEGTMPRAKVQQEGAAQPAAKAVQPSNEASQTAQIPVPAPEAQTEEAMETASQMVEEATKMEVAELTGTVMDASGEIVLSVDDENYAVTGEDLSNMVGKTVRVFGSLQEAEGQKTIKVLSIFEVQ